MAKEITDFQPNVEAPDTDYPYGQILDNTGTGNGTDMNRNTFGDMFQFFAKMMDYSGTTYNHLPDNAHSGFQFFNSLIATIKKLWITGIGTYTGTGAGDITTTLTTFVTVTPSTALNSTLMRVCANGDYQPSAIGERANFFLYQNSTPIASCKEDSILESGIAARTHFNLETKVPYVVGDVFTLKASVTANNASFFDTITLSYDGFGF